MWWHTGIGEEVPEGDLLALLLGSCKRCQYVSLQGRVTRPGDRFARAEGVVRMFAVVSARRQ